MTYECATTKNLRQIFDVFSVKKRKKKSKEAIIIHGFYSKSGEENKNVVGEI
jgi:hypothetical protein